MIITYLLYEKKIQKVIAYHGTDNEFEEFDYSYIGMGKDSYGPGFYFADSYYEASLYGKVGKYELSFNKYFGKGNIVSKSDISKLIKWAPNYKNTLTDFGENKREAFFTAIKNYSDIDITESFLYIWKDFYLKNGNSKKFVENLVKLGYDGYIVNEFDYTLYVMYNINNIKKL